MNTISIEQIKHLNASKGGFWFSPDTMRFFNSRIARTAIVKGDYAYFITSEQREYDTPRKYSIRKANLDTGDISTVGEFHSYVTHSEARKVLRDIVK